MNPTLVSEDDRNTRQLSNYTLDHSNLLSIVDGDEDLLRGICALFLGAYPQYLRAMREAIASGDSDALRRAAHTLKGSGGHFLSAPALEAVVDLEAIAAGEMAGKENMNSTPGR